MKRTIFVLATLLVVFVTAFAVLVLRPVRRVKANPGCSNGTLMGSYGVTVSGFDEADVPWTYSALFNLDGNGGLSATEAYTIKFFTLSAPGAENFTGATYTVNSDCSMTFTIGNTVGQGVIVKASGGEVVGEVLTSSNSSSQSHLNAKVGTFDMKAAWGFE
jgi:hypothetical protein